MPLAFGLDPAVQNFYIRGTGHASALKYGAAAWIRVTNGTSTLFATQNSASADSGWAVCLNAWVPQLRTLNGAGALSTANGTAIPRRQRTWMHYAALTDGTNAYALVNGVIISIFTPPTAPVAPAGTITCVGVTPGSSGVVMAADAQIYDVCVWTATEIDNIINNLPAAMKLVMAGKHCGEGGRYLSLARSGFTQNNRVGGNNLATFGGLSNVRGPATRSLAYQQFFRGRTARRPAGGVVNTLVADVGTFTVTANAAGLPILRMLGASAGAYAVAGNAAGLPITRKLGATTGAVAVSGKAAALPVVRVCAGAAGSFTVTGNNAALRVNRVLTAAAGSFVVAGSAARLSILRALLAAKGTFVVAGNAATLKTLRRVVAATGAVVVTGYDAQIIIIGANAALGGPEPLAVDFLARIADVQLTVADAKVDFAGNAAGVELAPRSTSAAFN